MAMISTAIDHRPTFGIVAAFNVIAHAFDVQKSRAALKNMDWAQLDDLGLSAKQAMREAKRPFWSAPAHWRR